MSDEAINPDAYVPPPEGWVQIPIRRGVFEISRLLDLRDLWGGRIIGG